MYVGTGVGVGGTGVKVGMGVGVSAILVAHSDLASSQAFTLSSCVGNLSIAVAVI